MSSVIIPLFFVRNAGSLRATKVANHHPPRFEPGEMKQIMEQADSGKWIAYCYCGDYPKKIEFSFEKSIQAVKRKLYEMNKAGEIWGSVTIANTENRNIKYYKPRPHQRK